MIPAARPDPRPHALRTMVRALVPRRRWSADRGLPALTLRWRGCGIDAAAHTAFCRLSGLDAPAGDRVSIVFPQVATFRLAMALLTDRRWPLPIWRALQVRNRLTQHRPVRVGERFDAEASVAAWRVLDKGVEVDIATRLLGVDGCAWEGVVTFYYRGRFGPPRESGAPAGAPAAAADAASCTQACTRWRVGDDGHWGFAALTGDYNGVHQWHWYARRLGFAAAFAHPHRIVAACLAHAPSAPPANLDLWMRGPVFYGREVALRRSAVADGGTARFALWLDGDPRAALIGAFREPPGRVARPFGAWLPTGAEAQDASRDEPWW